MKQIYQFLDAVDPTLTESERKAQDRVIYWDAASQSVRSIEKTESNNVESPVTSWQVKNSDYTAKHGDKLLIDTSTGSWDLTMPSEATINSPITLLGISGLINNKLRISNLQMVLGKVTSFAYFDKIAEEVSLIYCGSNIGWVPNRNTILILPSKYDTVVLNSGAKAYYKLDELIANKISSLIGSIPSGTAVSMGAYGQASLIANSNSATSLQFFPNSSYIDLGSYAPFQITTGSLEIWVQFLTTNANPSGNLNNIFAGIIPLYASANFSGKLGYYDTQWRVSNTNIINGNTHHVVVTFEPNVANNYNLYVNGSLVWTRPLSISNTLKSCHLGFDGSPNIHKPSMYAQSFAVYDKVLSQAEILNHYNVGIGVA